MAPITETAYDMLTSGGAKSIGFVGFCWGGGWAADAVTAAGGRGRFGAGVGIHPSFVTTEKAEDLVHPMMLLLGKNDPDFEPIKAITDQKSFGPECFYKRYDQEHGFCTARGDWTNAETKAAVDEALKLTTDFLHKHLAES